MHFKRLSNRARRAEKAIRNAFESPVLKRFIQGICMGLINVQVAKDASELFTPGVKLPRDERVVLKRVRIVCKKSECANSDNRAPYMNYNLCERCRKWSWGNEGYEAYEPEDPAYLVYMFRSFEDFLTVPHLPFGLKHFRRVKGNHLRHAMLVQHNIRRKLLGMSTDDIFPSIRCFEGIRDAFIVRQRSVSVSRICRALAPLDQHTLVLYEIIRRIVPAEASRFEIVQIVERVMQIYRN